MTATVQDFAAAAIAAGVSVAAIKDGEKRPVASEWQRRYPQDVPMAEFAHATRIGIVAGRASGNVEILDFDHGPTFEVYRHLASKQYPGLLDKLPIVRSPNDGYHVYYRADVIAGNQKLATAAKQFKRRDGKSSTVKIETRGEGGQCVAPPTPGYKQISGPLLPQIETITIEEREALLRLARSFDEAPPKVEHNAPSIGSQEGRPGDEYNERGDSWHTILEPHGWREVGRYGDVTHWQRPGKDDKGLSATTGHCGDMLHVFSSNATPFEADSTYTKFRAYSLLNHGGDWAAAAKELGAKGYGAKQEAPKYSPPFASGEAKAFTEDLVHIDTMSAWDMWANAKEQQSIPTRIKTLNKQIGGGLPCGQVTVITGYTGVGKSELARQFKWDALTQGHCVVHVDVELRARRILERDLSMATQIPSATLRARIFTQDEAAKIAEAKPKFASINDRVIMINPPGAVPLDQLAQSICQAIEKLREQTDKPILVICDSIHRLADGSAEQNVRMRVTEFMRWLEWLAKSWDVVVLATGEQKRGEKGGRPGEGEGMTAGAESRAIEFTPDIYITMHPEKSAFEEDEDSEGGYRERTIKLKVEKTREGWDGWVREQLVFVPPCWGLRVIDAESTGILRDRILMLLEDDPDQRWSLAAIQKKLKKKRMKVMETCKALVSEELAWEVKDGPRSGYQYRQPGVKS